MPKSFPITCFFSAGVLSTRLAISPCLTYTAFRNRSPSISSSPWTSSVTCLSPDESGWNAPPSSISIFAFDTFLLRCLSTLYFLPFDMNSSSTDILVWPMVINCSIFFPECCLKSAKLTASRMLDFPAPLPPIIMDIPVLNSILEFLWDLKFFITMLSIII